MKPRLALVVVGTVVAFAGLSYAQEGAAEKPAPRAIPAKDQQENTLKVGDKAPPLQIEKWVKGQPITGLERGRTYVVEFWATWCGPCIASIPHLSELQKEYGDRVTIIGVTSKDPSNSLAAVEALVRAKGEGMGYTVAFDDGRKTSEAYLTAAGQHGIPTSFVVDGTGTITYIGHPMWLDIPLDAMAKGKWDLKEGAKAIDAAEAKLNKVSEAQRGGNAAEALKSLEDFEWAYPKAAGVMAEMKYAILIKAGDPRAADAGRKLVDKAIKERNPISLNEVAWSIVDPEGGVKNKDLALALQAASKAAELTGEKDGAMLDTLAWVYFTQGYAAKAAEVEKKAIAATPERAEEFKKSLETFEAKK